MPICSEDIDQVWSALKNEVGVSFPKVAGLCTASSGTRKLKMSASQDSQKQGRSNKDLQFLTKGCNKIFDIDSYSTEISVDNYARTNEIPKSKEVVEVESVVAMPVDLNNAYPDFANSLGDSDDEDDMVEDAPTQVSNDPWRIERFPSLLASKDATSRVTSLQKLKETINSLLQLCPAPPELNQPRPCDTSNFNLDANLPLVSDLVYQTTHGVEHGIPSANSLNVGTQNPCHRQKKPEENDDVILRRSRLQAILNTCGNSLFRLVSDKSKKCRCLSVECIQSLLLAGIDVGKQVPYMIPAIVARYPPCTYDKDMDVFVQNHQLHEFYKRGGATERQDRDGLISQSGCFQVIESNEELRLALCRTFRHLVRGVLAMEATRVLDAYYQDIILSLQTSLGDPFPDVKVDASLLLVQLLRVPQWERGAKYFATGLARAALPNLRHRNTKVIISALDLFEASVCVPDRAKRKGAGSAAIADVVGFRQENVLPIAAFYDAKCGVSVNTLAELASHKNPRVRKRCCEMLAYFLTFLPDRYDHQQRILPYVLSFVGDGDVGIREEALSCIETCGFQYEEEHPEDVIERRQLGVDGEDTIDYDHGLPHPFTRRPRLGSRLFVRSNTSRFFLAVLGELSSWRDETRKRSADLLLILTVYLEEHLTKDFQQTIHLIATAIEVERNATHKHKTTTERMSEILRLMAKYVDPAHYLPLIHPRILGDNASATTNAEDGSHSEKTRCIYTTILSSLIEGATLHKLIPHWMTIASLLTSSNCMGPLVGTKIMVECLNAFLTLMNRVIMENDVTVFTTHLTDTGEQAKVRTALLLYHEALEKFVNKSDETDAHKHLVRSCIENLSVLIAAVDCQPA